MSSGLGTTEFSPPNYGGNTQPLPNDKIGSGPNSTSLKTPPSSSTSTPSRDKCLGIFTRGPKTYYITKISKLLGEGSHGVVLEIKVIREQEGKADRVKALVIKGSKENLGSKVTLGESNEGEGKLEKIQQETAVYESLAIDPKNSNICKWYSTIFLSIKGIEGEKPWIVLKKYNGDIRTFLSKKEDLEEKERWLLEVAPQLLNGLKTLFEQDIVCIDIKPENILEYEKNGLKIAFADLGGSYKIPRTITEDNFKEFPEPNGLGFHFTPKYSSFLQNMALGTLYSLAIDHFSKGESQQAQVCLDRFHNMARTIEANIVGTILYEQLFGETPYLTSDYFEVPVPHSASEKLVNLEAELKNKNLNPLWGPLLRSLLTEMPSEEDVKEYEKDGITTTDLPLPDDSAVTGDKSPSTITVPFVKEITEKNLESIKAALVNAIKGKK